MEQPEEFKLKSPEQHEKLPPVEVAGRSVPSEANLEQNEDAIAILPKERAAVLCDGVGGTPAGEKAAQIARNSVGQRLREMPEGLTPEETMTFLKQAIIEAHQMIFEYGVTNREAHDLGTTIVSSKLLEQLDGSYRALIAQVGDSRAYIRHASGVLEQITLDDNILSRGKDMSTQQRRDIQRRFNEVVDPSGLEDVERVLFLHRNRISQNLGQGAIKNGRWIIQPIDVNTYDVVLNPGEEIILMSDGISDFLTDSEMAKVLNLTRWAENIPKNLIDAARARTRNKNHGRVKKKGSDDMSVIVLQVSPEQPTTEAMHDPDYFRKEIAKIVGTEKDAMEDIPVAKAELLPDGFDAEKAIREIKPSERSFRALYLIISKIGDIKTPEKIYTVKELNMIIEVAMSGAETELARALKLAEEIPREYGLRDKVIEFIHYRADKPKKP